MSKIKIRTTTVVNRLKQKRSQIKRSETIYKHLINKSQEYPQLSKEFEYTLKRLVQQRRTISRKINKLR